MNATLPLLFLKRRKKIKSAIDMLNSSLLPDAYLTIPPIIKAKLLDVKHLLQYIFVPDHIAFYAALRDAESAQHFDEEEVE